MLNFPEGVCGCGAYALFLFEELFFTLLYNHKKNVSMDVDTCFTAVFEFYTL